MLINSFNEYPTPEQRKKQRFTKACKTADALANRMKLFLDDIDKDPLLEKSQKRYLKSLVSRNNAENEPNIVFIKNIKGSIIDDTKPQHDSLNGK